MIKVFDQSLGREQVARGGGAGTAVASLPRHIYACMHACMHTDKRCMHACMHTE